MGLRGVGVFSLARYPCNRKKEDALSQELLGGASKDPLGPLGPLLGPLGFEGAQHRPTLRPSVDGTRTHLSPGASILRTRHEKYEHLSHALSELFGL